MRAATRDPVAILDIGVHHDNGT
ncbi:hypothetical protein [Methylobacterium sp. E-045]|nr:hypothetical protein [Methylobacterium sp. E-045]